MKRRALVFAPAALAGSVLGSSLPVPASAAAVQLGQAVVWPTVALLGGGYFGPEQAAGKAVVVVFWSTTCPFCKRHNQHL